MPRDPIRVTWRDRRPQDAGRRPGREDPSLPYGTTPQTNIPDSSATARRHARAWARNEPESTTWAGETWPRHRDPSQGPNGCRYRTGTGRRAREGPVSPTVPGSSPVALRAYLGLWAYLSSVLVMSRPFLISFNSFVFICLFFFNLRPFCCSSVLLFRPGAYHRGVTPCLRPPIPSGSRILPPHQQGGRTNTGEQLPVFVRSSCASLRSGPFASGSTSNSRRSW